MAGFRCRRHPLTGHHARSSRKEVFIMDPTSFRAGASLSITAPDGGRHLHRLARCKTGATEFPAAVDWRRHRGICARLRPGFKQSDTSSLLVKARSWLQAFDLRRLELAGEAVPIAQGMGSGAPRSVFGLDDRRFGVSVRGVQRIRQGPSRNLPGLIGQGNPLGTAGEPGGYNYVALSRDGTRVAVSRRPPHRARRTSAVDIWVHEFARGMSTRLTTSPAADWLATWSPDGSRIIFSSDRDGGVHNLYQKARKRGGQ